MFMAIIEVKNLSKTFRAKLKEKGLITYTHLPLTKEELETVILGGDVNE